MDILLDRDVELYIKGLSSSTERAQISQYLDRQGELGHHLKEPVSKALKDGVNEIRPGPHRLLFFFDAGKIIVVHVFRKKTQKTPDREIKAAVRKRELWRQHA